MAISINKGWGTSLDPNEEENEIIDEVKEYIKKRYFKEKPVKFEVFEPLTPEWKSEFKYPLGGYAWGDNWSNQLIHLTRCRDRKAFYELVFHEVYRLNTPEGHETIFPKERHYIEEKFGVKLDKWLPLQDEIIRTLYCADKKILEDSFKNCGEQSRTMQEIEQRARELGL
jgi:hypothetical protein